ncbi:radical SAM protein [Heliobacillus mobilis]|uniref:FeMo cofactor biosynthesis protein NifB n=1 Tax=Heliobacterium mobile TaxID=28064 RepID=A0A6I3SHR7_HELMO|nr:radical SAM protein [Heliobacterium mobile]MTV48247.1 radical SAM protein [Heliobacterium mobile]
MTGSLDDGKSKRETPRYDHLVRKHPCFNGEAHVKFGRIHLPVSPACNIQCRYCRRGYNKWEQRPGVSRGVLTPEEALLTLERALELCPEITVAGIAGPGDTLATDHALEAFRLIHRRYPQIINCLSTNGLLLAEKAEQIAQAGVVTLTVTVNAIDPVIAAQIYEEVRFDGKRQQGEAAAAHLIRAQLAGIEAAARLGLSVKVNVVLIPGINDGHIGEVARVTDEAGASNFNIIPLIPQYEFQNHRPPDCQELQAAREAAETYLPVFRHCRHCRADACGIPGKGIDLAGQLYDRPMETFSHG